MHKIMIVSRCQHKALKTTRKIVDSYAIRISDKSWNCNLTQEGLQNLTARLKASARKNSAIAIYFLKDGMMQKYTIIGNRKEFGLDGACPVSTTSNKHASFKYQLEYKNMSSYKIIMDFIGYSHDLGKISAGFQDMLRDAKKKKADPFRHEFLSILILASENKEDLIRKIELIEKKRFKFSMLSENKNMNWIFKIILSHHLSPELSGSNIVFSKHIRDVETKAAEILKFYEKKEFQDILLKAYELRDKVISMDININRVHYIYFRNALMLSDHYISMKHQQKNWGGDKKTILAKSMELGGEHLSTHLYSVGKMGSYIIEDFTRLKRKLMSLGDNELIAAQSSARGKYIWQNQGVKSLKSVCKNNNCNIVFIGAATGMGKTRMALRVATELAGEDGLRLNVALGLRTLTTQTSKVYKEILEVDNSMIATLIGSTEVVDFEKKIEALDKTLKNKEDKWDENFKDVNKNELEDGIDLEDGIIDLELPKYVANKADSEKKKKLISTPIVISTIDYLIKASDWRKSSHLLSHLRIMTSDLIIDEIDMFDKSDFLHILRMVYVTGLYGRNLIITTATILPKMADLIYSAYFEGVEQFSLYSDGCSDINISYLSDAINKSITDSSRDYEDGLDLIEDCLIKSSDYYYKEHCVKPKHKVKIIDDIQDDYFSNIVRLHENNKIEDIKNNINYSVGLIRIQNIADCYDVVKKISNSLEFFEKNDCYINVIFYHARLPIAIRSYIESKLDKALYRKGVKDPFMKSDLYRDGLLKNGGRFKNIITLVIASPVIEVGRDFDFDWGIVEPTSSRAIIQTMGRVNRHRDMQVKKENIFIMNKNYRVLRGYGKAYSNYDGNEDIDSIFSGIINNPTSSLILNPEKDSLSFWENEGFGKFVIDSFMGSFFGTSAKMVSDKLVESAWRASSPDEHQYVLDIDEDKFLTVSSVWDNKYREVKLVDENICFNNDGIVNDSMFFINSFNIDEIISSLKDENNDEFNNKFMKINTIKSKNKSVFSKIFGII